MQKTEKIHTNSCLSTYTSMETDVNDDDDDGGGGDDDDDDDNNDTISSLL